MIVYIVIGIWVLFAVFLGLALYYKSKSDSSECKICYDASGSKVTYSWYYIVADGEKLCKRPVYCLDNEVLTVIFILIAFILGVSGIMTMAANGLISLVSGALKNKGISGGGRRRR